MEKYEKIRFVNKGAFGSAVLVRQKSDGKQYIMKVRAARGWPSDCHSAPDW